MSEMLVGGCLRFARDSDKHWAHSELKDPQKEIIDLRGIQAFCSFANPHRKGAVVEVGYVLKQISMRSAFF